MTTCTQEGPFLMWTRGLILNLPEDGFEVSIICSPQSSETLVRGDLGDNGIEIPGLGGRGNIRYVEVDSDPESTIKRIRGEKLDVLIYNELGTSTEKFILPFFRLASVQCAYWCGSTSGSPEMDYFISSDAVEPDNGQDHYLEKLVRLKSPIIHFTPPPLPPEPKERGYFGFTEADHIYACPQGIHKIHPDMDKIFGDILRRDPAGQVALLEGGTSHWTEAMVNRLKGSLPDVAGRIRLLTRMTREDFLGFLCISDVIDDLFRGHFLAHLTLLPKMNWSESVT